MSNSFNISSAVELAAIEAKVDIIDTEVDAVRALDIPFIYALIDTVVLVVDAIRAVDVPAIQTNIDSNETKIDTIDGIVDAIKLKTDATPQNLRGSPFLAYLNTTNAALQPVVNITGHGKLNTLMIYCTNAGDTIELKLTIDGTAWTLITHTGDIVEQTLLPDASSWITAALGMIKLPSPQTETRLFNIEFDTSLLVEIRRSAGATAGVRCNVTYTLDNF